MKNVLSGLFVLSLVFIVACGGDERDDGERGRMYYRCGAVREMPYWVCLGMLPVFGRIHAGGFGLNGA